MLTINQLLSEKQRSDCYVNILADRIRKAYFDKTGLVPEKERVIEIKNKKAFDFKVNVYPESFEADMQEIIRKWDKHRKAPVMFFKVKPKKKKAKSKQAVTSNG